MQEKLIPNLSTIPMWLIFMAACFVLNHFIFKPTLALMAERRNRSTGLDDKARLMEKQLQGKFDAYQSEMMAFRKDAKAIREKILHQAADEKAILIKTARAKSESYIEAGQTEISGLYATASKKIATDSEVLAQEILKKLTGKQAA